MALPPQRVHAHDIARRAVATDQIIPMPAARHGAADAPGRRPDDLGIMADIAPVAGGAVVWKTARLEIAIFLDPGSDHRHMIISVARTHPEIFALPFPASGLVIVAKYVGPGHGSRIKSGIFRQRIAPLQVRRANLRARPVMGVHHHLLQRVGCLCGGSRNGTRGGRWNNGLFGIFRHPRLRLHRNRRSGRHIPILDLRPCGGACR